MNRFGRRGAGIRSRWILLVACLATGCGPNREPPPSKPEAVAKKPKITRDSLKVDIKPVEVKPDEFPNIPAALAAIDVALEKLQGEEQNRELLRCEKWIALQKEAAIEPLGAALNDPKSSFGLRITLCKVLTEYGPAAAGPLMTAAEKSDKPHVQRRAVEMLGRLKPPSPESIPFLRKLLSSKDDDMARQACISLGTIGEPASAAAKQLSHLRENHGQDSVRRAAGDALRKVSPRHTFEDK